MLLKTLACMFSLCDVREVNQPKRPVMCTAILELQATLHLTLGLLYRGKFQLGDGNTFKGLLQCLHFRDDKLTHGLTRFSAKVVVGCGKACSEYLPLKTDRSNNPCLVVNTCKHISWEVEAIKICMRPCLKCYHQQQQ